MHASFRCSSLLSIALLSALAAPPATRAAPESPSAPGTGTAPAYDAELAKRYGADERGMRLYVLVILKTGPTPVTDPEKRKAMFAGHFANMERLGKEGKLVLAGPFEKNQDGWRGLFVFAVADVEQARKLVATDPVVINGEMVPELHPWYGTAAVMAINVIHPKLEPPKPATP